ncbi:MAG TPA: protein kinase, partial [Ktedonobacteraceae bacterium]|nr:protein kinase [Ktedonobacteraceae bacterium]
LLLTDFGIAKLSMLTTRASQSIRGTPTYMAPEQWEGRPVPATDQYALAVMLYELLTGQPPFRGTPMQMMYAHVNAQPQTPSSLNARLSSAIDTVVLRGLAKRPEERFPSIIAFAFAFRQALRSVDASIALGISHPETYTLDRSPITLGNNGLNASAILSISEEEARNGANRNITLPGGRQVRVRIPAGVKDRQVIRVLDQSEQAGGSSTVKVYLTLSIVPSANNPAPLPTEERRIKDDVGVSIGKEQKATLQTGSVTPLQKERTPDGSKGNTATSRQDLHEAEGQSIGTPDSDSFNASVTIGQITNAGLRRRASTSYLAFIILLIALLVISSTGLFYYLGVHHSTSSTSGGANIYKNKTGTANTHTTGTANAQKDATAKAVATHANPYPPYNGTLRLSDPMSDNNQGHHWQVFSGGNTGNSCEFVGSAYHLVETPQNRGVCFASNTDYTDFTYQVVMTFIRSGKSYDGGGIVVRGNGNNYYYFEVFESGRYTLMSCTNKTCNHTLVNGLSQAIPSFHSGLDQPNILAIEVKGFSFALFVNGMQVGRTVSDSNSISSHGMIGVFGAANDATTEVVYKDAKVWG